MQNPLWNKQVCPEFINVIFEISCRINLVPKVSCVTLHWKDLHDCHTFLFVLDIFCFYVTWCPYATSMCLSVSSNETGIKSETSGVMWHVAPESKIQSANCKLSPKFPLGHSSLLDMRAIDAYIFCSLLFSVLLCARLTFSLKITCFRHVSLSFGGFGHFTMRWSSDPHLKHFWGVRYDRLLFEAPAVRAFSFSCLSYWKTFLQSN